MTVTRVPVVGVPSRLRLPDIDRTRLDNGLDIVVVPRHRLPLADALLVFPSGAASDPPGFAGRASLAADLLDCGTAQRALVDIARELDRLGARMAVHSDWDYTSVAIQSLPDSFEPALAVLADVVTAAAFPAHEFDRGKAERLAAILQDLEDPEVLADSAIARAVHGVDHIYGLPRCGTQRTVGRLDRDTLVRYHRGTYGPAGAFLVVVGDIRVGRAARAVEAALGAWSGADVPRGVAPGPTRRERTVIHLVNRPGAPQSELRIGTVGAARSSPDYFPLVVLNTVLGGTFTSRLNTRLREQSGYTYGAYSGFAFRVGVGPFVAWSAVDTDVTDRAVAESLEEIERLCEEPVPEAELERAKRFLAFGLPRGFERNGGIASRLADIEVHGLGRDYWREYGDRVAAVSAGQVSAVARRYLDPSHLAIVVVGDAVRVRPGLEKLGAGPVLDAAPVE